MNKVGKKDIFDDIDMDIDFTLDDILDHFNIDKLSDLPSVDELSSAGLIDDTSIDSSIFGTGKFFKEQSDQKKDNIYDDIEKTIEANTKKEE